MLQVPSAMAWIPAELDEAAALKLVGEMLFSRDEFHRYAYRSPTTVSYLSTSFGNSPNQASFLNKATLLG